jgi:AMMECR1 domain-containing protein
MLKDVAKRSIRHGVRTGQPLPVDPAMFPAELREKRACFVTLRRAGKLRGCIGALEPDLPLVVGVSENSFKAGFRDPRFPPLGVDGVVLRQGSRQATFLPAVWQELPDPAQFLRQLKRKAGLAVDGWPDAIEVCRYTTESVD